MGGGANKAWVSLFSSRQIPRALGLSSRKGVGHLLSVSTVCGKSQGSGSSCLQLSSQVIANSQAELWKNEQLLSWQPQSHDIAVGRGQVDIH